MRQERSNFLWLGLVCLLATGLAVYASSVALGRWDRFETNAFDLGFFDQIIYNTLHLRPGQTTFIPYNFNGQHVEPILLIFLIPYALGAGPPFLMITQAVVASAAAVPLFGLARRLTGSSLIAAACAVGYLLNGYLHRGLIFDFHPEVMIGLPVFASVWAMTAARVRVAAGLALSCLLFKEDAGLVAAALGVILWIAGERRTGIVVVVAALGWLLLMVTIVMPLFRQGAPSDIVDRYGYLVGTVNARDQGDLLPQLARRPWVVVQALGESGRMWTLLTFAAVTAPLALLRPVYLLLAVPSLLIALLAGHHAQAHLELHYAAEALPLAIVAGVMGAAAAQRRLGTTVTALAAVVPAFAGMLVLSPYVDTLNALGEGDITPQHREAVLAGLALIPGGDQVTVAAQSGLLPRLSQRDHIHEFPARKVTEWVIVDRYGQKSSQSIAEGYDAKLEEVRGTYERVFDEDGVEVFHKP